MNTQISTAKKAKTAQPKPADIIHAGDVAADPALCNFHAMPATGRVRVPTVATLLGVSVPTVWRYAAKGTIPRPTKRACGACRGDPEPH